MLYTFLSKMTHWTQLPEDMELELSHKLIQITTLIIHQTRLHLEAPLWIQNLMQAQYIGSEILKENFQMRKLLISINMSKTKLKLMVRDKLSKIIVPDMSWTPLYGMLLVGPQKRTSILIKTEPSTESNSISQNLSIKEKLEKLVED